MLDDPPLPPAEDEGVGAGPWVEDTTSPLGFAVTGGWSLLLGFVVVGAGGGDVVVTAGTETGGGLVVVVGSAGGSALVVVTGAAFVDVVSGVGALTVGMGMSAEELSSSALRARAPRFLW